MVLWARVPSRLPCFAYSFSSVPRIAGPTYSTCYFHHIPIIPKVTKYTESSNTPVKGPAYVPLGIQTPHFQYLELRRGYEHNENKDSLGYTNLSQASQASSHDSTPANQFESNIRKDTVALLDNNAELGSTQPISEDAPIGSLSEELRMAMRKVAYPIAVVTSAPISANGSQDGKLEQSSSIRRKNLRGLLVSSFNTVTLKPEPYISFNVKLPSRTWDAITQSKEFMVHLMWSHTVAQKFAPGLSTGNTASIEPATALDELSKGRTIGLRCKLASYHKVQDHIIVVGNVLELMPRSAIPGVSFEHEHLLWKEGKWHTAKPLQNDT